MYNTFHYSFILYIYIYIQSDDALVIYIYICIKRETVEIGARTRYFNGRVTRETYVYGAKKSCRRKWKTAWVVNTLVRLIGVRNECMRNDNYYKIEYTCLIFACPSLLFAYRRVVVVVDCNETRCGIFFFKYNSHKTRYIYTTLCYTLRVPWRIFRSSVLEKPQPE